jgi:hypothetical protein
MTASAVFFIWSIQKLLRNIIQTLKAIINVSDVYCDCFFYKGTDGQYHDYDSTYPCTSNTNTESFSVILGSSVTPAVKEMYKGSCINNTTSCFSLLDIICVIRNKR